MSIATIILPVLIRSSKPLKAFRFLMARATLGAVRLRLPSQYTCHRRWSQALLKRRDHDAPRIAPDADRLRHLQRAHADDGDVIGGAVGGQKKLLVGGERHLPDALANEQVLHGLQGSRVDLGRAVRGSERHE